MTESNKSPQVSATIDPDLYKEIADMADKNDRTISKMVAILLEQAVKERKRNRHGKAKNNSEYNSPNMGEGDG